MVIHWIPLLCGLFLGLIPATLLVSKECRYLRFEALWKRVRNPQNLVKRRRRRWWKLPLVWIDPVRGYVVADLLSNAFSNEVPAPAGILRFLPYVMTTFLLLVVVIVQTSGRDQQGETISPSGFLAGMMVALLPLIVALSAIAIGLATTMAMNRFFAGYLVATITIAALGYVFLGRNLWLASYTLMVAMPLIVSLIRRTSLVMPVRA